MGDFANCCYHNIFIFTARQKQCLPNKILDIQYNTVIIFLFMLLKIPSSVPGSINVYFPCLPFLYFFFYYLTWKWAEYHVCGWNNFPEEFLLQKDLWSRNCWYKLNQNNFSITHSYDCKRIAPLPVPLAWKAAKTEVRWTHEHEHQVWEAHLNIVKPTKDQTMKKLQ